MPETSTSPAPGEGADPRPMLTVMPAMSSPRISHSPVCRPARTSIPSGRTAVGDRPRAFDARARAVEGRQEAVAGRLHLAAPVAVELLAHDLVVALEQLAPAAIAELGAPFGGVDDVGEEHGEQLALGLGRVLGAGQELLRWR